MSHQENISISFKNYTEMCAIRAVLVEFGYKLYYTFEAADTTEGFDYVLVNYAHRGFAERTTSYNNPCEITYTLAEFIDKQAIPVKSPAQLEVEKLEKQVDEMTQQIAKLKTTIQ
jgi:hypothetical protein